MKRTSFVSVAAVSVAACIGASSASAQPFDFRAHVTTRAATAVGAVQACAVQWNAPTPPPTRLHIEAFIGPRGLGVRLTEGEGLRVWRNCATTALYNAIHTDYNPGGPRLPMRAAPVQVELALSNDPPPAPVNLVTNGGFESPAIPSGSFRQLPSVPGWTRVSGEAIEVQAGVAGAPAEGRNLIELAAESPTVIAQEIATRAGARYEIRFSYAPRPGTPAAENRMEVRWDGRALGTVEGDGTGRATTAWRTVTYTVTATGPRTTLSFGDAGVANTAAAYLDDVRVLALP
jgi:hypothetical protein